jgi:peroxiredoxin/mono/diheme cytochrome c family protein
MTYLRLSSLALVFLLAGLAWAAEPEAGKRIANFRLNDYQGAAHALDDHGKSKLVVVAFLGTDCPLANRYADRLVELSKEYEPRGVAFLAIDSNKQDSLAELAHFARKHKIDFPLLKDPGNVVADRFGARRTPEVFVLDAGRVVRYRGRIDDQYGVGYARPAPRQRDLAAALDELLAGKPVSQPVTEPAGCFIGRVEPRVPHGEVTYSGQVAGILQRRCAGCHRAGGIAPFALTSYREASAWAETVAEVIQDGRMPPWDANPRFGKFANDPSLSAEEKQLLKQWLANGVPEGKPGGLPPKVAPAAGWRLGKPDVVLRMPAPYKVPARGTLAYQYFSVDPGFKEDRWVQASEVRPGNPSVVHHAVIIVQPPGAAAPSDEGGIGDPVAVFAPGTAPMTFPEGTARLIPAGSKLVFQMHYTPNGSEQTDQTSVGIVFADPARVRRAMRAGMAINTRFRIPAREADYQASADYRFGQDAILYALYPHMHLRGKAFRFEAVYPDRRREVLLDVPRYRFDWQDRYVLAEPKRMPEGTVLHCEAHFDNSEGNLSNPNPDRAIGFGVQTWDEMLVGYFDMALAEQDLREGLPRVKELEANRYEVTFRYKAPPGTKEVYLAGPFNGWKPAGHKMDGPDAEGRFTTRVELKAGRHEYKFVLEGKHWRHDPGNPQQVGYFNNSVLQVGTTREGRKK